MTDPNKAVSVKGRLSFPIWTAQEAYDQAKAGPYAANTPDVASSAPSYNLLLTQEQYDKVRTFFIERFLPFCESQFKKGDKDSALEPADVKKLVDQIEAGLDGAYNTPFKKVSEKSLALMPDAAAQIKVIGKKGVDFTRLAAIRSEAELLVPDPKIITFPAPVPIGLTDHELYPGCWAGTTVQAYAYKNGKNPGFSVSSTNVVWMRDDTRFGGAAPLDLDELFADED